MKRLISILLSTMLLFCSCTPKDSSDREKSDGEICAVWIFYNELSMKSENGGTKESFTAKINTMYQNCIEMGINTVFVQVRPFGDAFYPSELFPWSEYLTGQQGKAVDYDPLQIMIDEGHSLGLSVHAWLNPFRVSANEDENKLNKNNKAFQWLENKTGDVVKVNGGIYYSPASLTAQRLVLDGVREIVENYQVDGIHIDDYFYPSTDKSVDHTFYEKYKNSGGELSLKDWRLETISSFVGQMYSTVKSVRSDCIFSISPAGNIKNNYNEQYADVKLWCSRKGYADWIIPQLYYGFQNEILPFDKALKQWCDIESDDTVEFIWGIGAYRVKESDSEWDDGLRILTQQIDYCKSTGIYSGASFFSYSSLINNEKFESKPNLGEIVLSQTPAEQE